MFIDRRYLAGQTGMDINNKNYGWRCRMRISYILGVLGCFSFLVFFNFANAEQTLEQNPCMYYPDSCRGGSSRQPRIVINIPTHWGMVAADLEKGIIGVSENVLKGKRAAKKQALQACKDQGGVNCKVYGFVRNSCIAYGTATKKDGLTFLRIRGASTIEEAQSIIREDCRSLDATECKIYYSHCNKDPRYDMY
ncbi:hypothetical protein PL75_01760 [Neisseria arctica]|uniref:DUF4189 domain-containing protein n=1 Tax=Neisseria arctica TaxID=1470200 RepID=A0A0J0YUB0_9NEIS|nr:DUF4189 domain-containing protein [Neisseria arctica]KLT73696.1 hypothetical protein PL75_01760 [Neisseria arctica]UOO85831.1 DUF4189 domain-containing protein [Neisseria arctica]